MRIKNIASSRGFTLIELLIVIGVIGILATVVLAVLNPLEQLARGRDSGRINSVAQLGHAVEAYATTNGGTFPTVANTWQTALRDAGEIKKMIDVTQPSGSACTAAVQLGYCYGTAAIAAVDGGGTAALVWTILESDSSTQKVPCTGTQVPAAIYSSFQGKAGIGCLNTATTAPAYNITLK